MSADAPHKVVMVTGQQDECTQERFDKYYKPAILKAIEKDYHFVLGAAERGADPMTAALLAEKGYKSVTVFDKKGKDGDGAEDKGWKLDTGYESYTLRDSSMIVHSDKMIVYLFENAVTSGTWRNVMQCAIQSLNEHWPKPTADRLLAVARAVTRDAPHSLETWECGDYVPFLILD